MRGWSQLKGLSRASSELLCDIKQVHDLSAHTWLHRRRR